ALTGVMQIVLGYANNAVAGSGLATFAAVQFNWFAGDHRRGEPMHPRILIHDPRHHLSICIYVGCRDITLRTDLLANPLDELPRNAFQFALRELRWVAGDTTFGAAERHVYHRSFPSH